MLDAEPVEQPPRHEVHEIVNRSWLHVETRGERDNRGAGTGKRVHVADVNAAERGFAVGEQQRSTLLERDGRGSLHKRARHSGGDRSKRVARARHDDHAVMLEGTTGDDRAHVPARVQNDSRGVAPACQRFGRHRCHAALFREQAATERGDRHVHFDIPLSEQFDGSNGIGCARGTADPDDDSPILVRPRHPHSVEGIPPQAATLAAQIGKAPPCDIQYAFSA